MKQPETKLTHNPKAVEPSGIYASSGPEAELRLAEQDVAHFRKLMTEAEGEVKRLNDLTRRG